MKLQKRVQIFVLAIGLIILAGGAFYFRQYSRIVRLKSELQTSLFLASLDEKSENRETLEKNLLSLKDSIVMEHRQKALDAVIESLQKPDKGDLKSRLDFLRTTEIKYIEYLMPLIQYTQQTINYMLMVGGVLALTFLLFLRQIINDGLFRPVVALTQTMEQFLEGKYTYDYNQPDENEVGRLQENFHKLAQKVISQMTELTHLDQAKSDFLSIASHELRTPLTSLKGSLGLLQVGITESFNDHTKQLIHIAESETDRLIALINDLLDLTKIEAGAFTMNQNWISLSGFIEDTKERMRGLQNSSQVEIQIGNIPDVEVYMDRDRIQQVLINLLSNSIKFSPPKTVVRIFCEAQPGQLVKVSVNDSGPGIPPEDQHTIFEKFRQSASATKAQIKGTGLGLTIAKAFIKLHGGEIGLFSQPGEGSTFYFTLPDWKPLESKKRQVA